MKTQDELVRHTSELGTSPTSTSGQFTEPALPHASHANDETIATHYSPPSPLQAPLGWPDPPRDTVWHGLAGKIVRTIGPQTEADPMAILLQLLVALGNVVGRSAHFQVEATRHYLNLFLTLVGDTSKARKGTSWGHIDRLFSFQDGWSERIVTGLSSGEGLICEVRDGTAYGPFGEADPGVTDKRRIVLDGEFASTLKMLGRQGNTLSPVCRNAWDSGTLRILTKNSPAKATGVHISIIGHITRDELRRELNATEQGNGFANRFLWCCVRRSRYLPDGGDLPGCVLRPLADELREVVGFAETVDELKRDDETRALWHKVYPDLSEGKPGLVGSVIARAEAQVMRLACLYAVLDQSSTIRLEHLEAALAVWEYCEASARFIFGASTGDVVADRILGALLFTGPRGMSRTDIRDLFHRNETKSRIEEALALLTDKNLARREACGTGSRQFESWVACQ